MAKRDNEIKEGFGGMNFSKKSELFHEMPEYRSRTKKSTPKKTEQGKSNNQFSVDYDQARQFLEDNHYHLKTDLNSTQFNDVVLALLEYKNKS